MTTLAKLNHPTLSSLAFLMMIACAVASNGQSANPNLFARANWKEVDLTGLQV